MWEAEPDNITNVSLWQQPHSSLARNPNKKAEDGHRSIAVYLLDENQPRFMGTVGVPDRYPLPNVEQVVEIRYLYCHPGPDGKLIQAKYFGKVRDDVAVAECTVGQLKFKADDDESADS